MNEKVTGGPAFPDPGRAQSAKQREILKGHGMTLRDYFAAKAMQGLVTKRSCSLDELPKFAYLFADAMLAERSK